MPAPLHNPIRDKQINTVLDRLHARSEREIPGIVANLALQTAVRALGGRGDEGAYVRDKALAIERSQGWLIYMLCRSLQAERIVEFGTSLGVSTLYLAAAARDQGKGLVIGSEIEPQKARQAREHFSEAGVADLIELREGDARTTLKDCGGPIDFLLMDGFPRAARPIIELLAPQLRRGAMVVSDNVGHFPKGMADYLDFVRRPSNGFASVLLPLRGGTELSVRI
jgi:predicted O-methyltransferase YrrM